MFLEGNSMNPELMLFLEYLFWIFFTMLIKNMFTCKFTRKQILDKYIVFFLNKTTYLWKHKLSKGLHDSG